MIILDITITGASSCCPQCGNHSVFPETIYEYKYPMRIFSSGSYIKYSCKVCDWFSGKPIEDIRNDKLKKLGIK